MNKARIIFSVLVAACGIARAAGETQNVTISQKVQIPGAVLKPGTYTLSVEDRLQDRAIVRISTEDPNKHYLILTVPSEKLSDAGSNGLIFFTSKDAKKQALRGWKCPSCAAGLEFVYPKLEAAKLTDETTLPVLAVDPTYDKLPAQAFCRRYEGRYIMATLPRADYRAEPGERRGGGEVLDDRSGTSRSGC